MGSGAGPPGLQARPRHVLTLQTLEAPWLRLGIPLLCLTRVKTDAVLSVAHRTGRWAEAGSAQSTRALSRPCAFLAHALHPAGARVPCGVLSCDCRAHFQ